MLIPALLTAAALAGTNDAETCLRAKVWESYSEGWGVRTLTSTELDSGKTHNYLVNLFKGNQYRIATCGDKDVVNLDVFLYDQSGAVIARDSTSDRQPMVEFTPPQTGSYYVVLYAKEESKSPASAAMAVIYK
jgi:hypothetical protein